MGETESRLIWPYLPYKIHADHPRVSGKKYGPIGHIRRHSTPWEVPGDACRVRWSGVAINATNRVHQCVFFPGFSPSHTGYMVARPGTSTYGSFRPQRPCSTIPLGMHLHTDHAAVGGARGGPRGRTLPAGPGGGPHVFCMGGWAAFGLSHTNCMGFSAIRFVWPNICIFPKVDRGWQNYFDNAILVIIISI